MLFNAAVEELAVRPAQPDGLQAARCRRLEGGANGFFSAPWARDFVRPIKTVRQGGLDGRSFQTANVKILKVQRLNGIHFVILTDYGTARNNNTNPTSHKVTFLLRI